MVTAWSARSMLPPTQAPWVARVIPARRRADLAQLRVDHRAVVALVVVLGEDLPVGRDHVVVDCHPAAGAPARRGRRKGSRSASDSASGAASPEPSTKTRPCHSSQGSSARPCSVGSQPAELLEAGRRPHRPVEAVGPRVVRADDPAVAGTTRRTGAARGRGGCRRWRRPAAPRPGHGPAGRRPCPVTRPAGRPARPPARTGRRTSTRPRRSSPAPMRRRPRPRRRHAAASGTRRRAAASPPVRVRSRGAGSRFDLNSHTTDPMILSGPGQERRRPCPRPGAGRRRPGTLGPAAGGSRQGAHDGSRGPWSGGDGQGGAGRRW